jgi:hypothetical protein
VTIRLAYPPAVPEEDFTERPRYASSGRVVVLIDGRKRSARIRRGSATVHSASPILVRSARDGFGNTG